jgi:hypothetical protein
MSSTELPICHESNVRAGEALDNLRETPFLNSSSSFRSIKPFGLSRIPLRPVIELSFHAKQEHSHLAKNLPLGELFLVMKIAKWSFAHNVADQASFLVCLLACSLGGLPPLHRPPLRDNPPVRFAGCQQQDLTGPAFADTQGRMPNCSSRSNLRFAIPTMPHASRVLSATGPKAGKSRRPS